MASKKKLTLLLVLIAVAFGLVNVFLIPPFMNPDEIQHFMFTANYAYNSKQLEKLDAELLQLLKDYKWFHFIGVGPGWEKITRIKDIYFLNYFVREKYSVSKTYFHFLYGHALKLSGIKTPIRAFYFLRFLSLLFYLAIFLCCLWFYQTYFPDFWIFMASGQLLLFQPTTILTSVNYDVLLVLLGVLFFILAYRFLATESEDWVDLTLLVVVSALAAVIKKGGLLFFLYLFLLLLFKSRSIWRLLKRIVLTMLITVVVFSWFNYLLPGRFFALYTSIFSKYRGVFHIPIETNNSLFEPGFFTSVWNSFYFYTGWMGFKLDSWWYIALNAFFFLAIVGAIGLLLIKKCGASHLEKKWHLYIMGVIGLQLLSIWLYYGSGLTAQGRYLYPLLLPIITLLFGGLHAIEKYFDWRKHYLLYSLLVLDSFFLVAALVRIISVFYLEIASPHPGL